MNPTRDEPGGPSDRALIPICALAAILRFFHLGYQSLWVDEMMTLTVATPKPGYPIWQLLSHNVHGPLHTLVVYLFRFAGENDAWLRLPSAIAGLASVPLIYAWLRPRFGSRVARTAAFLLAVNPLHIHYSQELRNYSFAVCFVLLGCVAYERALTRWRVRAGVAWGACAAAAVLCNFSTVPALAAQSFAYLRRSRFAPRALVRWVAVSLLAAALVAPWIYRVDQYVDFSRLATPVLPGDIEPGERLRGDTTVRVEAIPYTAYVFSVGFALGPSLAELHDNAALASVVKRHAPVVVWVALLFGGLVIAGVAGGARRLGAGSVLDLVVFIVVPLAVTLVLNWQNAKAFNARYVIVGLPAYLALVALGIEVLGRTRGRMAVTLVAATSAFALWNHFFDPDYAKENVRAATAAVDARLAPGECIFAPTVWPIVAHYRTSRAPLHYVYRDPPGMMDAQLAGLYAECPSFWYLRARPWVDDADGYLLAALSERYQSGETLEFPGVSVIHFTAKP